MCFCDPSIQTTTSLYHQEIIKHMEIMRSHINLDHSHASPPKKSCNPIRVKIKPEFCKMHAIFGDLNTFFIGGGTGGIILQSYQLNFIALTSVISHQKSSHKWKDVYIYKETMLPNQLRNCEFRERISE